MRIELANCASELVVVSPCCMEIPDRGPFKCSVFLPFLLFCSLNIAFWYSVVYLYQKQEKNIDLFASLRK